MQSGIIILLIYKKVFNGALKLIIAEQIGMIYRQFKYGSNLFLRICGF